MRDLVGVVARMLIVLVQGDVPRHLLRRGIDLDRACQFANSLQHVAGDRAHGPVGSERDPARAAAGVLHDGLVGSQIQSRDERSGAVRGRERIGLPSAGGQTQRSMLQLRFRRRQRHGQLAEQLGVRVQRVAGRAPLLIDQPRPAGGHGIKLAVGARL